MAKPKNEWGLVALSEVKPLTEKDVQSILQELNLNFSKSGINEVVSFASKYEREHYVIDERPRKSEIKAALEELQKSSRIFKQLVAGLDQASKDFLCKGGRLDVFEALDRAKNDASLIYHRTKYVLPRITIDKGGHPPEIARELLIERLMAIYEKETSKKVTATYNPYYGNTSECVSFIFNVLEKIKDKSTRDAIVTSIKKIRRRNNKKAPT